MTAGDPSRHCEALDREMAAPTCLCGARSALQHLVGKRALVHKSVREAAGRKGMTAADQHRDCDIFESKTAAQTCFCGARCALQPLISKLT